MDPGGEHTRVQAEAHGAAHIGDFTLFRHQVDDGVAGVMIEFGTVGRFILEDRAAEFHHHQLHSQAETQVGDFILARVADGFDLAFDAAAAETTRHQNGRCGLDLIPTLVFFKFGRVDPAHFHIHTQVQAGVLEGFVDAHVGVVEFDIFTDQGDLDLLAG